MFPALRVMLHPPRLYLPRMASSVRAGVPSPAGDHVEKRIDLNAELISHPEATFYVRVEGNSMTGAGILEGDELVVDRALDARHDDIVIAIIDNEFTVKRFWRQRGKVAFLAHYEGCEPKPVAIGDAQTCDVWGVVTNVIRKVRK